MLRRKMTQRKYLARILYEWAVPRSKLPAAKRRHLARSAGVHLYLILAAYRDLALYRSRARPALPTFNGHLRLFPVAMKGLELINVSD